MIPNIFIRFTPVSILSIGPSFFDVTNIIIDAAKGIIRAIVHMATITVSIVSSLCRSMVIYDSPDTADRLESLLPELIRFMSIIRYNAAIIPDETMNAMIPPYFPMYLIRSCFLSSSFGSDADVN